MKYTINGKLAGAIIVVLVMVAAFAIGSSYTKMQSSIAGAKQASAQAMDILNH